MGRSSSSEPEGAVGYAGESNYPTVSAAAIEDECLAIESSSGCLCVPDKLGAVGCG